MNYEANVLLFCRVSNWVGTGACKETHLGKSLTERARGDRKMNSYVFSKLCDTMLDLI